jgi:hypothetical protein
MSTFIDRCVYIFSCTLFRTSALLSNTVVLLFLFFEILLISSVIPFWLNGGLLIGLDDSFSTTTTLYGCNGLFQYTQSLCTLNLNNSVIWLAMRIPYTTRGDCRSLVYFTAIWNTLATVVPYWLPLVVLWCISVIATVIVCVTLCKYKSRILCCIAAITHAIATLTTIGTLILFCVSMYVLFINLDPPPVYIVRTGIVLHVILICALLHVPIYVFIRNYNYSHYNYELIQ